MASLGGGHGLYQTLLAARRTGAEAISAIVTVADDGGSSGRLRREMDIIPPGDLRMALAALSSDTEEGQLWAETLQHRFQSTGAMAGHAVGNLLIAGLTEVLGDFQAALDAVARLTESAGRVLPAVNLPLEIEADVSGLDDDPRIIRSVRGQVAVASTVGQVRRVRIIPEKPRANPETISALHDADLITLGPGSWFSSVLPHVLVPDIVDASGLPNESERVFVQRAASVLGATAVFRDVCQYDEDGRSINKHCPDKLAQVLTELYAEYAADRDGTAGAPDAHRG